MSTRLADTLSCATPTRVLSMGGFGDADSVTDRVGMSNLSSGILLKNNKSLPFWAHAELLNCPILTSQYTLRQENGQSKCCPNSILDNFLILHIFMIFRHLYSYIVLSFAKTFNRSGATQGGIISCISLQFSEQPHLYISLFIDIYISIRRENVILSIVGCPLRNIFTHFKLIHSEILLLF